MDKEDNIKIINIDNVEFTVKDYWLCCMLGEAELLYGVWEDIQKMFRDKKYSEIEKFLKIENVSFRLRILADIVDKRNGWMDVYNTNKEELKFSFKDMR